MAKTNYTFFRQLFTWALRPYQAKHYPLLFPTDQIQTTVELRLLSDKSHEPSFRCFRNTDWKHWYCMLETLRHDAFPESWTQYPRRWRKFCIKHKAIFLCQLARGTVAKTGFFMLWFPHILLSDVIVISTKPDIVHTGIARWWPTPQMLIISWYTWYFLSPPR